MNDLVTPEMARAELERRKGLNKEPALNTTQEPINSSPEVTPEMARQELDRRKAQKLNNAPLLKALDMNKESFRPTKEEIETFKKDPTKRKDLLLKYMGKATSAGLKEAYAETLSPIASGASSFAFGVPKAVASAMGSKELIFPEQKTPSGKLLRAISEGVGFLGGGAVKVGEKIAGKMLPKVFVDSLGRKTARQAIQYGIASLMQTPEKGIEHPISTIPERAVAGGIGAAGGAAAEAIPAGISKGVSATKELIKKIPSNYLSDKVAPVAKSFFDSSLGKFTDPIQRFLKDNKVPESAIKDIKAKGVQKVLSNAAKLGDNTDLIYQRIQSGLDAKEKIVHTAYNKAINAAPEGKSIDIKNTIDTAKDILQKIGYVNSKGEVTALGESEIYKGTIYGKMVDLYKSADAFSGVTALKEKPNLTQSQMVKLFNADKQTNVNKNQFIVLRDKINSMYKGISSDIDVRELADSFYNDGESSGMIGLNQARALEKANYDVIDRFTNKNTGQIKGFGERNLDKYHNFTQEQKRSLSELAEYIADKTLLSDLSDITSARYLNQANEKFSKEYFQNILNRAIKRTDTESAREELTNVLGKEAADTLIDEVIAHRRARIIYRTGQTGAIVAGEKLLKKSLGDVGRFLP